MTVERDAAAPAETWGPDKDGRLGAYGSTFVLAPSCSFRLARDDSCLFTKFLKFQNFAILVHSECQPTTRAAPKENIAERELMPMLCADAQRLLGEENAGGSSRISEAMSCEVLARAFGAVLLKTELELVYWPANGPITDFAIEVEGTCLGVSVTRALAAPNAPFTVEAAMTLLRKKLNGVLRSTETCVSDRLDKQCLHIWARTAEVAKTIEEAYAALEGWLTADTVVLVTVCGLDALFSEKARVGEARLCRRRMIKGLKDEGHMRVLHASDPLKCNGNTNR